MGRHGRQKPQKAVERCPEKAYRGGFFRLEGFVALDEEIELVGQLHQRADRRVEVKRTAQHVAEDLVYRLLELDVEPLLSFI